MKCQINVTEAIPAVRHKCTKYVKFPSQIGFFLKHFLSMALEQTHDAARVLENIKHM